MSRSREVLQAYRLLHKACQTVFKGDPEALQAAQKRVREEFVKNRNITDQVQISKLLTQAKDAAAILRHHVVQAAFVGNNTYRVRMTQETRLEDNAQLPNSDSTSSRH